MRLSRAGLLSFINRRHGRHGFTLVIGIGADGGPPTWHASCHQSNGPLGRGAARIARTVPCPL
jgi:hypothetical protein